MTTVILVPTVTAIAIVALVNIIYNISNRAYQKGYKQAKFDVTYQIFDRATWFGGSSIKTYNVLYVFAYTYRKKGYVDPDRFRKNILEMNHEKRITDSPIEELDRLIN